MRALLLKFDSLIGIQAFLSYCIVGGLSAAISFASFALFWNVLHINYKFAVTVSYVLAILFNFLCNRYFTFKGFGRDLARHMYRYITMIVLNYAITMFIVHADVEWFALSPYIGLFASIAATAVSGFLLSRFWVFASK